MLQLAGGDKPRPYEGFETACISRPLHFGYPVKLSSKLELNLLLDIFNILNRQGETSRSLNYTDQDEGTYEVVDWDTGEDLPAITPNSNDRPPTAPEWNTANVWQDPTTVRIGIRLSF